MSRILILADLHHRKPWFDWLENHAPEFDAVVIAGDLLFDGQSRHIGDWDTGRPPTPRRPLQAYHVGETLKRLVGRNSRLIIAACSGNHDTPDVFESAATACLCPDAATQSYRLGNYTTTFTCIPFDAKGSSSSKEIDLAWPAEPPPRDALWILIHHVPPAGTLLAPPHQGQATLTSRLLDTKVRTPDLVCCGHFHLSKPKPDASRPWCARLGDSWIINPGSLDPDQNTSLLPIPPHVILDREAGTLSWHSGEEGAIYKAQPL